MRKVLAAMLAVMTVCLMAGCGTEVVLDVTQFNRISREKLEEIMGEPADEMLMADWWQGPISVLYYETEEGDRYKFFIDNNNDRVTSMQITPHSTIAIEEEKWNDLLGRWNVRADKNAETEEIHTSHHINGGMNGGIENLMISYDEDEQGEKWLQYISVTFDVAFNSIKGKGQ